MQVITCIFSHEPDSQLVAGKTQNPSSRNRTHQQLLEAARAEFGERGIEAATTRAIAKRAGVNEVTLFRHFESKQKLLAAVIQDTSADFEDLCSCRSEFSGDLLEDLSYIAEVYTASFERCEGMARQMIAAGQGRPNLAKELIGDVIDPFHASIARYLEEAKEAGKLREDTNCQAIAEILTGALMAGVLRRGSRLTAIKRPTWIRETVNLLAKGMATGSS